MNANELADDYTENNPSCWDGYELHDWARKAATMLRQQQAEIELLNAKLAYMFEQELKTARLNK